MRSNESWNSLFVACSSTHCPQCCLTWNVEYHKIFPLTHGYISYRGLKRFLRKNNNSSKAIVYFLQVSDFSKTEKFAFPPKDSPKVFSDNFFDSWKINKSFLQLCSSSFLHHKNFAKGGVGNNKGAVQPDRQTRNGS